MREVFVHQDRSRVGLYQSILEDAGIATFVRNEAATNMTEMPSPLFFPVLCVVHDNDYDEAMRLLGDVHLRSPSRAADWPCPTCSEEVPASFDACWQCDTLRPEAPPAPDASETARTEP